MAKKPLENSPVATASVEKTPTLTPKKKAESFDISNPEETMHLANDLARFISENKLFHNIQGKEYVNVEGWQYAGSRLGILPIVEELQSIGQDTEIKYQAKVKLFDLRTSQIVGTGFAICSNKEATKRYYQEFAIASMAQTRAIGKAYRNILAWIIRAAGYEPTPAEEMDYAGATPEKQEKAIPNIPGTQRASDLPPKPAAAPVTEEQIFQMEVIMAGDIFTDADREGVMNTLKKSDTFQAERQLKNMEEIRAKKAYAASQGAPIGDDDANPDAGPITIQQKTQILLLLSNSAITALEKEKMIVKINTFDTIRAERSIEKLKKVITDRTAPTPA